MFLFYIFQIFYICTFGAILDCDLRSIIKYMFLNKTGVLENHSEVCIDRRVFSMWYALVRSPRTWISDYEMNMAQVSFLRQ